VLSKVGEHDGVSHFSWRPERAPVPAISPEAPASRQEIVHVPRDAHGDAAHTTRKCSFVRRFDDQMKMIALHREMHHAEALRIATSGAEQRKAYRREHGLTAERRQTGTERDVHRLASSM